MPVRRGDQGVWLGPINELVTVGTISPSGKTMIIRRGDGEECIVDKSEVITMRQAKNRGITPESRQEPSSDQLMYDQVLGDTHPY